MDGMLLIGMVIGALLAFFLLNGRRPANRPIAPSKVTAPPPPPPLTDEERIVQEAVDVRDHWESEREAVEEAHMEEIRPLQERIEKARQFVKESGVGDAVCDILRIMWHWPSWSKGGVSWQMPISVTGLEGGKTPGHMHGAREGIWLGWTLNDEPYRLELTISPNYTGGDSDLGDLRLWVGEQLVMQLDVWSRLGDEYYVWRVSGVSAFKAGPWMRQLNEFAGRLRIADRQWDRDRQKQFYGEKDANIKLD